MFNEWWWECSLRQFWVFVIECLRKQTDLMYLHELHWLNCHSPAVAFQEFELPEHHSNFPTLWTPSQPLLSHREPTAPAPMQRQDVQWLGTSRSVDSSKFRVAMHRPPDRTCQVAPLSGRFSLHIRQPVVMNLPAVFTHTKWEIRWLTQFFRRLFCHLRTMTTSTACWYKLRAASGNVVSIIFAALSNAPAPASADPCCWYRRHARCAKSSISIKLFCSFKIRMACSKQRAAWNSDRFCIWHSAAFIRQLLHWSNCLALRKHVAAK